MKRNMSTLLIISTIVVGGFLFWVYHQDAGMIELISSALTPIIALTVAYIAYKQYKIDNDNLRLALYEKRFKVYQSVKEILAEASFNPPVNTTCSYISSMNGHNKYSYFLKKYFDN